MTAGSYEKNEFESEVSIGGKTYGISSDDKYLEHIGSDFEPDMVRMFTKVATGSECTLDIGANIGCTALLFGGISKKVYAFEPSRSTFSFLEKNVARAGMDNVFTRNIGLGSEAGEFTLTFSPSDRSGGFVSNQTQASVGHAVENIVIRRLDDVIDELQIEKVDFMKIDVEGFEGHVLRGAQETLAAHKPVVVMELNHWCLNAFQRTSVPDFFDFIRGIFPVLYAVEGSNYLNLHDEGESYAVMYNHIIHMKFGNILAAYHHDQIQRFLDSYQHGLAG